MKVAINGFGRIGKCIFRAIYEMGFNDIELVSINCPSSLDYLVHSIKYDSVHGYFSPEISIIDGYLVINDKKIKIHQERDIEKLDWENIDIVFECTGKFNDGSTSKHHLKTAKKLIISAPAKNVDATIVYGVNDSDIKNDSRIISVGSCTTNCLAPIAYILNKELGIKNGFVTTIHSYTNDQRILDSSHSDLRRSRACNLSMIPTKTGAASALGEVIPDLKGKLDGVAVRVPTANVSMIDLCFVSNKNTNITEINNIIKKASENEFKNIIEYTDKPLVSNDFIHNPHSAVFDSLETKIVGDNFVRIMAWYDNEWAFSVRMLDVARKLYAA